MRVNIDLEMRSDPRFRILANALGEDLRIARDRAIDVWFACTRARSATIPTALADAAAERDGYATALVAADLATFVDPDSVRIRGIDERIRYMARMQAMSRVAGERSAARRLTVPVNRDGQRPVNHASDQTVNRNSNRTVDHNSDPPAPAPSPAPETQNSETLFKQSPLKLPKPRKRRDVSSEASKNAATVLKSLGGYSGVGYRVSAHHEELIASRMGEGLTILDLRKVAWYCAEILGWKTDSKFRHYLRPETLYGPRTINRYLDPARTEYRKQFGTDEDVNSENENSENGEAGDGTLET